MGMWGCQVLRTKCWVPWSRAMQPAAPLSTWHSHLLSAGYYLCLVLLSCAVCLVRRVRCHCLIVLVSKLASNYRARAACCSLQMRDVRHDSISPLTPLSYIPECILSSFLISHPLSLFIPRFWFGVGHFLFGDGMRVRCRISALTLRSRRCQGYLKFGVRRRSLMCLCYFSFSYSSFHVSPSPCDA